MSSTVFDTLGALLVDVGEGVDDPDVRFRLRTARQLVVLLEDRFEGGRAVLEDLDLDDETRERLQELGYLG